MRVALHLLDVGNLHIREPLVVAPHHFVGDTHDLAVHFKRRLVDADRIAERLRHFLHAVEAFQNRRSQHYLRFLSVGALHFAAYEQVEFLIGAAEFDIGFEGDGVVSLDQRVEQFVDRNRFFFVKTFMKVLTLEKLRNRVLRHKTHEVVGG